MSLQKYINLGVKELQVIKGQAVAVNPYYDLIKPEWKAFKTLNLPPLPCHESVKEGRYSIDRFEEQEQVRHPFDKWIDSYADYKIPECDYRTLLILSATGSESEKPLDILKRFINDEPEKFLQKCEEYEAKYADEVAEKPEFKRVEVQPLDSSIDENIKKTSQQEDFYCTKPSDIPCHMQCELCKSVSPKQESELLKDVAEKLKDRELFPESNRRAKDILSNVSNPEIFGKPPIGLRPKRFVTKLRIEEILDAIERYDAVDKEIPKEWLEELNQLKDSTTFQWTDDKVFDFVNEYIVLHKLGTKYTLENQNILDAFKDGSLLNHITEQTQSVESKEDIHLWLESQKYQTAYEETGEYKMYFSVDMPKILTAYVNKLK